MSLARDDVSISRAINVLETDFIKSRKLENNKEISGQKSKEPEINDVFEKKSNNNNKNLEKLQDDYNSNEIKNKALSEIDSGLDRIKNSDQAVNKPELLEKSLDEINKVIEKIAPNDTKDKNREVKNTTDKDKNSSKKVQSSNQDSQRKESIKKINELKVKVNEKRQQIANHQKKLYHEVSSLVELHLVNNDESSKTYEVKEQKANDLQKSVTEDIKKNPVKSKKIQITHFDKNMILAMLSLHQ